MRTAKSHTSCPMALSVLTEAFAAGLHRYCLASLKVANTRNAAEIVSAVRLSSGLAKDVARLKAAVSLFTESEPAHISSLFAAPEVTQSSKVGRGGA